MAKVSRNRSRCSRCIPDPQFPIDDNTQKSERVVDWGMAQRPNPWRIPSAG